MAVNPNIKRSPVIDGVEWLGPQIPYPPLRPGEDVGEPIGTNDYFGSSPSIRGDTYPMTWADDDEIYASSGDPGWGVKGDGLDVEKFSGFPPDYTIRRVNIMAGYKGWGGEGQKPSGMICVNGVLYLGFQNLLGKKPPAHGEKSQHGSDASIVMSKDHGKTWMPDIKDIKQPMFPGNAFGGPAFVNFGKDNAGARDNYVYAISTDQWDNGSYIRVGRVPNDRIMDIAAWEFVSAVGKKGKPTWAKDLAKAVPVLTDDRRISIPDMVYVASIKRYILLTWRLYNDFSPDDGTELIIYDAPEPWGPFTLAHYEEIWEIREMNPYCPRIPLKWLKQSANELTGWLQFSGSWRKGSAFYRSHVRNFRLKLKT